MGSIIGAGLGIAGSLLGGSSAKTNDLTGYNYLSGQRPQLGAGAMGFAKRGEAAGTAESELLGLAPASDQTKTGFNNYLNSTGYKFQLGQGTSAITGSAAARGILNSGSTAKALTSYGQGLAAKSFDNYLSAVHGVGNQGLTATDQIGSAGTTGGMAAGKAMDNSINNAFQGAGGQASNLLNFFGSV